MFTQPLRTPIASSEDHEPGLDLVELRSYRLGRVQAELRNADIAAALLVDPINIRYATGSRNMTVWLLHNLGRYCVVPAHGDAILFEFPNGSCRPRNQGIETIGEVRAAKAHSMFLAGEHAPEVAIEWAREIADLCAGFGARGGRLAVDRGDVLGIQALQAEGLELVDGQTIMERARSIKSQAEIACMRLSVAAAETGMWRMREALRPGITENQLWAELHHANIAAGGEWIEARLLSSGGRTNPWFQESSNRMVRPGDLVSFDTDLIGPFGYCADISRTYHCGPGRPSGEQISLYRMAAEQVAYNCDLLRPGLGFRELGERAWKIPGKYQDQYYGMLAHGVGMCDEWPCISYLPGDPRAQDGELVPGMTICIESYIGEVDGHEGVKLEEQVLITEDGYEVMSSFPLEETLL